MGAAALAFSAAALLPGSPAALTDAPAWRAVRMDGRVIERPLPYMHGRHRTLGSPVLWLADKRRGRFSCEGIVGEFHISGERIALKQRPPAPADGSEVTDVVISNPFPDVFACPRFVSATKVKREGDRIAVFRDASAAVPMFEFVPEAQLKVRAEGHQE